MPTQEAGSQPLKGKQEDFCHYYVKYRVITTAASKAGYAWPDKYGSELLGKTRVQERIDYLTNQLNAATMVDAEYVRRRLVQIDQMDFIDIHDKDGNFLPLHEWPAIWRQSISGMEAAELWEGRGDYRKIIGVLKKIKWPDKIKNLELLGRHVSVGAWERNDDGQGDVGEVIPVSFEVLPAKSEVEVTKGGSQEQEQEEAED